MLVIRLTRVGKKNQARFRMIVQEKQQSPKSIALEIIGHLNPHSNPVDAKLNKDRVLYWLSQGAKPSATVHNLLVNLGLIKGPKQKVVKPKKKKEEPKGNATAKEPQAEKPGAKA